MATVVLVVDDNDDVGFIDRTLQRADLGAEVRVAEDGQADLDGLLGSAAAGPGALPAMVILDLKMPRVDGFEVLRWIRADERTRMVPVVVFTSSSEPRDIDQARRLGASGYVRKPHELPAFRTAVVEMVKSWAVPPHGSSPSPWTADINLLGPR